MQVNWPKWSKIINERFVPLTKCTDRYVILYGSRGSSKSDYVTKQLIFNCLTQQYFKCILYRRVYETIKESSYETIKQNIYALGLESLFAFRVSPLSITCVNGNRFIARGGDDALSLKSIKDPTCVWYEEDVPNEEDFATITLTVRSSRKDVLLQEFFTINPQVEGDYRDNWFWKRFFKDKTELSFRTSTEVELEDGQKVTYSATVHHSTYKDNRWLPSIVKATIEGYKYTNEYLYSVYAKGLWTTKETGGNFYKAFKRAYHVKDIRQFEGFNDGHRAYNKNIPLHITFDFNVNPYMTLRVWQLVGKTAYNINEICLPYPRNTSLGVCREFERQYPSHEAGLYVYGDPQGLKNYTAANTVVRTKEEDYNEFAMILNYLKAYRPSSRVSRAYPPVKLRGDFMNAILSHNEQGIEMVIDESCTLGINDYMYLKEASDGTKHKEKVKDDETGVTYEKYGHCSDADEYLFCAAFKSELAVFKGVNKGVTVEPVVSEQDARRYW